MSDGTNIEWTDATWNPVRGCSRKSPGCGGPGPHGGCYAEIIAARFSGPEQPYEGLAHFVGGKPRWTGKLTFVEHVLDQPLRWSRSRKIFVNSMSDLFHENMPDEWIDRVFAVMALAPQHTFQVLTKRPERMASYLAGGRSLYERILHAAGPLRDKRPKLRSIPIDIFSDGAWHQNIWLGMSIEDQLRADERREPLRALASLGWRTWVSYEPALGPVYWDGWEFITWLVAGGESGPHARPCHPDWARSARDWCARHGKAFFWKQWGEHHPHGQLLASGNGNCLGNPDCRGWHTFDDGMTTWRVGKKDAGRLLDGVLHDAVPEMRP